MKKNTFKEYLDAIFTPALTEVVAFHIHYSFMNFECDKDIKELLTFYKQKKDINKLYNFCWEQIKAKGIENSDTHEVSEASAFWADSCVLLKIINDFNNCIYLKTHTHGIFNEAADKSLKTPKEFQKMFVSEFLNAVAEFLREASINFLGITVFDRTQSDDRHFYKFFDWTNNLIDKIVSKKRTAIGDQKLIKQLYEYCEKIIWHEQAIIDTYGWDEENQCLGNGLETTRRLGSFEYNNDAYKASEEELFQVLEVFLECISRLLLIYELVTERLSEKFLLFTNEEIKVPFLSESFLDDYRDHVNELATYEEKWIYNSYCSFLSN